MLLIVRVRLISDLIAVERRRRSLDLVGSVEKCAKRIFPHSQQDPLCGGAARMPALRG